jgi:hypothetical protein
LRLCSTCRIISKSSTKATHALIQIDPIIADLAINLKIYSLLSDTLYFFHGLYLSLDIHVWHSPPRFPSLSLPSSPMLLDCHAQSNGCNDGQGQRCLWQEVTESETCDDADEKLGHFSACILLGGASRIAHIDSVALR